MDYTDIKLIEEFSKLPADYWDFKTSDTRCMTHGLHYYPAMMVYPISHNILNIVKKIKSINTLMDPFAGSGTVLVEGMLAEIPIIYGTDLNPLAILISKVKTTILTSAQLDYIDNIFLRQIVAITEQTKELADNFDKHIRFELNLDITKKFGWGDNAPRYLKEYFNDNGLTCNFASFYNLGFWFTPCAVVCLQAIKAKIIEIQDDKIRNFLLIAFSETVRNVSNTRNGEFKLFRMPPEKVASFKPDVFDEFYKIIKRNVHKMREFASMCKGNSEVHVQYDDTRCLKTVPDESIDLVITSPPYGDSRTTVAYGQFCRLSLQWLDLDNTTESQVINLDKNLLGGKPYTIREQWEFLGSKTLVSALNKIASKDVDRAADVFGFYVDLDKCLYTISQKTKHNGYQFWVVGNRTVKLEKLLTDKILSEMAKKYNLTHLYSVDRNIINKVMPAENSPTNEVGVRVRTMTTEKIVILKKE